MEARNDCRLPVRRQVETRNSWFQLLGAEVQHFPPIMLGPGLFMQGIFCYFEGARSHSLFYKLLASWVKLFRVKH